MVMREWRRDASSIGCWTKKIIEKPEDLMFKYFSARSVVLLALLATLLLVLPLLLPPLPPPPVLVLLVPVLIMSVLILLAFSPSQLTNVIVASL